MAMAALLWLIAGLLLIAAEVISGELMLVMLGVGGLAAAGTAALGAPVVVQVLVFAIASIGLVTVARPVLRRRLHVGDHHRTNTEALVGGKAIVVSTVDASGGQVKLSGEVWSARAFDETQVLEPGRTVIVMDISGATAVVWSDE
jgi:membrane protein implicated in regulation of membrane protease activity